MDEKKRPWGGPRAGAGRPKGTKSQVQRKYYSFRLTEQEHEAVKHFVKELKARTKW